MLQTVMDVELDMRYNNRKTQSFRKYSLRLARVTALSRILEAFPSLWKRVCTREDIGLIPQ